MLELIEQRIKEIQGYIQELADKGDYSSDVDYYYGQLYAFEEMLEVAKNKD